MSDGRLHVNWFYYGGCGSLHLHSPDIPGLHLCGSDPDALFADIEPATNFFLERVYGFWWTDWQLDTSTAAIVRELAERGIDCANPALAKKYLLERWIWAADLKERGCTRVGGKELLFRGESQDYMIWRTSWGHQFLSPVRCTGLEAKLIIAIEITRRFVGGQVLPDEEAAAKADTSPAAREMERLRKAVANWDELVSDMPEYASLLPRVRAYLAERDE